MTKTVRPAHLRGVMTAPASKSETHRRMICAGLTPGETTLDGFMSSNDMDATANCLRALGIRLEQAGDRLTVHGGVPSAAPMPVMDCGESGSTLRFFVPLAMALAGGGVFRMHGRLGSRPMDVYRDLFVPRGTGWHTGIGADGAAELHVSGSLTSGDYVLPGNVSSQFVSGLLFSLPLLDGDSTLKVKPPVESSGYIGMTLQALRESGIRAEEQGGYTWKIPGNQTYRARSGRLSGDYSQAGVFLCAGALGHEVSVRGLSADTTQGDRALLGFLKQLGAHVEENAEEIRVTPGEMRGTEMNVRDCPDVVPMLALVCQLSHGTSRLTGCGRLRLKECDRLEVTAKMLRDLGGDAVIDGEDLVIRGCESLQGGVTVETANDHRMVMLACLAGSLCREPVTVPQTGALDKSWPDFLNVYTSLGGLAD